MASLTAHHRSESIINPLPTLQPAAPVYYCPNLFHPPILDLQGWRYGISFTSTTTNCQCVKCWMLLRPYLHPSLRRNKQPPNKLQPELRLNHHRTNIVPPRQLLFSTIHHRELSILYHSPLQIYYPLPITIAFPTITRMVRVSNGLLLKKVFGIMHRDVSPLCFDMNKACTSSSASSFIRSHYLMRH